MLVAKVIVEPVGDVEAEVFIISVPSFPNSPKIKTQFFPFPVGPAVAKPVIFLTVKVPEAEAISVDRNVCIGLWRSVSLDIFTF